MTIRTMFVVGAAACALVGLAGCQKAAEAPAVDTAKEAAAINSQVDLFNASMKAGDVEKAISVEANDIRGYGGGGPDVSSASQDLNEIKEMMHDPNYSLSVKAEHTEVAKSGDLAWSSGSWDATATDPKTKKPAKASGHWVGAWRKDDQGRWKLAAVSNAPAGAPMAGK